MTNLTRVTTSRTAALILTALLGSAALAQTAAPAMPGHAVTDSRKGMLSGTFRALEAPTTGSVKLARDAQGRWTLTLSALKTEPAPDLHVWLVPGAVVRNTPELRRSKYLDLGTTETTAKSKTFTLPRNFEPGTYKNVVLWCDQFSVAFAAAALK